MKPIMECTSHFALRFVLFYWVCFVFPFPLDLIALPLQVVPEKHRPDWYKTAATTFDEDGPKWLSDKIHDAVKWVGREVLGVEVIVQMTGSGDTMRAYVGCLGAATIALALTCIWSLLVFLFASPGHQADRRLHTAVRILVRYFLIVMLLGYGFAKVFPNQFPEPTYRLTQTFGDLSPMGLLWAFMGFSPAYQMFTGCVEVAAGLLLCTRRTTPLGAILTIVAMTQVVALNLCFDVPVKLYSLHYLAMGLFLLLPDLPRIMRVMVLHQAVDASPLRPLFGSPRWDRAALVLRTLLIAGLLWVNYLQNDERWGHGHVVLGRWVPETFQVDGQELDPASPRRWKHIDFAIRGMARILYNQPPHAGYLAAWDKSEHRLTLTKFNNKEWTAVLTYDLSTPDVLILHGALDGKRLDIRLKRLPDKEYELTKRGFQWIQEFPYNR